MVFLLAGVIKLVSIIVQDVKGDFDNNCMMRNRVRILSKVLDRSVETEVSILT